MIKEYNNDLAFWELHTPSVGSSQPVFSRNDKPNCPDPERD